MLLSVPAAVPPPGSSQTATASSSRMPKLRRWVLRSGPTPETIAAGSAADGNDRRLRLRLVAGGDRGRLRDRLGHGVERLGRQPVADPEVRVDVAPARRGPLELLPQLAHEDVDGAVAVDHGVAPHPLVHLLPLEDLPLGVGEELDELELAPREIDARAG